MAGSLHRCTARLYFPSCPGLPEDDWGREGRRRGWRSQDEEEEVEEERAGLYRSWRPGRGTAAGCPAVAVGWFRPWASA